MENHLKIGNGRMRAAEAVRTSSLRIERCHALSAFDFELNARARESIAESRRLLARIGPCVTRSWSRRER